MNNLQRGDILLVSLDPKKGSELGKTRPCLVVQNNLGNKYSSTTIVVGITTKRLDKEYPTNVFLPKVFSGLEEDSVILCSQIFTISISDRVIKKLGFVSKEFLDEVDLAIKVSLGLD